MLRRFKILTNSKLLRTDEADEDYRSLELIENQRVTLFHKFNLYRTQLSLFSFSDKSFLRIKDFKENEEG